MFTNFANSMSFYPWSNPKTYAIFVPGLSLAIQAANTGDNLQALKKTAEKSVSSSFFHVSHAFAVLKIQRICRMSALGALAQATASSIALMLLSNPGLIIVAAACTLLATYQFIRITYVALVDMKMTIKDNTGSLKSINGFF